MLHRGQIYSGVGNLISFADYSIIQDTANYVHPSLTRTLATAVSGVVSGRFGTTVDGEDSFYLNSLDLDGKTNVYAEILGATGDSNFGKFVIYLVNSLTPDAISVITTGTPDGYDAIMGSGSTALVHRRVGGVRTQIGTFSVGAMSESNLKMTAVVNPNDVTLRFYKNDVETSAAIVDSDPARITNFRRAGKAMREFFSPSTSMGGFRAGTFTP